MKTILITGANSGIGKATTMALAQKGNELILVCRNEQKAKALETELKLAYPNALVHVFIADLSVMKSIQHLVQQIANLSHQSPLLLLPYPTIVAFATPITGSTHCKCGE